MSAYDTVLRGYAAVKQSEQSLYFDDMMTALANAQRRRLLISLLEHNLQADSPVVIAGCDSDADGVVLMRHAHLPKLGDYGFIEWNEESNEVTKGPKFDEIRPLLELLDAHEDELPPGWL